MTEIKGNEENEKIVSYAPSNEVSIIIDDLDVDLPEVVHMTEAQIEDKYVNSQTRIYIQRNDFLIPNILQMVKDHEILDLSPSYQRRMRWTEAKKSHLIESLLMNVPIPPIFLYEKEFAKYEVMDGQQRLSTIKTFYENEFKLTDLKKWPELNGRYFRDLPMKIQNGLSRRGLAAVIVLTESSQDETTAMELRQYVFERLNTGGQILNAQEIRNCIYSSHFNELLVRVARNPLFTSVWGIPPKETTEPQHISRKLAKNSLYSTMADCQIVLRYFALSDLSDFRGGMRSVLDKYMSKKRKASKEDCDKLEKEYILSLKTAHSIYEDRLFRLPQAPEGNNDLKGRRSVPLADAVLLSVRSQLGETAKLIRNKEFIVQETRQLLSDLDNRLAIVGRLGVSKEGIEKRLKMFEEIMHRAVLR
ncbi:hypothetical protein B1772_03495 [Dehalococcoides mccartyi]|jgi:hypothetical protein|uniref:DUF262 domain-containing protein n=1 Tax=Dehalococcoides mccartyi TaxID=61435 RepID=UPI00099DD2FF|nr:DUF262 domain-containing protein [Dehalococcoides mccartyi]AQX74569.1 hypothetical protein B1776_03185 [Dehalococcoides mccartyi]AQY73147.1 hypothetical protein B1772_03495 [Dehalococcoides mccartyi]